MENVKDKLIITAASVSFGKSLLALLGSLNLNWPDHPEVLVYDIGLDDDTREILIRNKINLKKVPPFCPHWRKYFTWKIWCINDAPAKDIVWMDAGLIVLKPLNEIFHFIDKLGYFLVPNYQLLDWEASENSCLGCKVSKDFRIGKPTLAGGLMGFRKENVVEEILAEALEVALVEKNMISTHPAHRHDQAVFSLLFYKHYEFPLFSDGQIFLGWKSPNQVPGQKVWVHRRKLHSDDIEHFSKYIKDEGDPHFPVDVTLNIDNEMHHDKGKSRYIEKLIKKSFNKSNQKSKKTENIISGMRD